MVTGSQDGTIRLWDLYHPSGDHELLNLGETPTATKFSSDGRWLLTTTQRNVYLWDLSLAEMTKRACSAVGRNFTQEEWLRYFPSQPYRKTCPAVPVPTSMIRSILHEGRQNAYNGNIQEATAKFKQALALEPDLDLDPETEAQRVANLRIDAGARHAVRTLTGPILGDRPCLVSCTGDAIAVG